MQHTATHLTANLKQLLKDESQETVICLLMTHTHIPVLFQSMAPRAPRMAGILSSHSTFLTREKHEPDIQT